MSLSLVVGSHRENDRSSRRDELGEYANLLRFDQPVSKSSSRWVAFSKDLVAESRFRSDRKIAVI